VERTVNQGPPTSLINDAYSSAGFDELSKAWQLTMAQHLDRMLTGESRVLNWQDPRQAVALAESFLTSAPQQSGQSVADRRDRFTTLLDQMIASGQNLHNPRYIGHQVPASVPIAGLFDAVGSITNQPMAIYEMGPWATAVEHALVRGLCRKVGWDPDLSSGVLTHGGSLANLTALLTARNAALPDSWENGTPNKAVLIAHADAHYCVTRAAGLLGLGTRQVVKAPLDDRRRMDPQQLDHALTTCRANGQTVIAVAAAACATPIGAFDPLSDIAEVCDRHGVWLHVDAAHGGGALMSKQHRKLLRGIENADSVVWDAHKMLFMPALCAAVLYKNKSHRFNSFQQDAPYLFDPSSPGLAEFDNGISTVECTKRSTGFGLWGLWSMFGEEIFEQLVDHTFAMTRYVYQQIDAADDFESCHVPECNILVFRYLPAGITDAALEDQNRFQQQLRTTLIQSGEFYIVQTTLDGKVCLRLTVMNPITTEGHLDQLMAKIREIGLSILQSQ
jgi:L-2,4-diaminobutyrate decarboxylase